MSPLKAAEHGVGDRLERATPTAKPIGGAQLPTDGGADQCGGDDAQGYWGAAQGSLKAPRRSHLPAFKHRCAITHFIRDVLHMSHNGDAVV